MFAAGYGFKEIKVRNLKAAMRFNKSSSANRGVFPNKHIYYENYGKPTYTSLKHYRPGNNSAYEACNDDPKHPGRARDFTLCTMSSYSSVCAGRQLIYFPYFFNFLFNI